MNLRVINSDSSGNCYVLGNERSAVLLDCGVKFKQIQQACKFSLMHINLCLITHEHQDHCRSFKQVTASGITVLSSLGTFDAMNVSFESRGRVVKHGSVVNHRDWKVYAFEARHDAKEPLNYIIDHPSIEPVLFITDSYALKHNLHSFRFGTIMIEANYCEKIAEQVRAKKGDNFVERRRVRSHMSLQTAIRTIKTFDLSNCTNIILVHLSDGLSDASDFKNKVEEEFGIKTTIADAGVEVELINY